MLLTPEDATFVQVLHTTPHTIGAAISLGDADFWANDGSYEPNCPVLNIKCAHNRSHEIFISSLNPLNNFIGKSKENDTELFGIHNNRLKGDFWFDTSNPFVIKSVDLNCN